MLVKIGLNFMLLEVTPNIYIFLHKTGSNNVVNAPLLESSNRINQSCTLVSMFTCLLGSGMRDAKNACENCAPRFKLHNCTLAFYLQFYAR
jgi:hypothetical protein